MTFLPKVQLGEICRHLGFKERDARYVLEQGHIPSGVSLAPASGNHRLFDPEQAYWLVVVLKLKAAGLKTPQAAVVANATLHTLRVVTQNLNWDRAFYPPGGKFATDDLYYMDIGDLLYIRMATTANPSKGGILCEFPWSTLKRPHKSSQNARPCVITRLDLAELARLLSPAFPSQA